MKIFIINSKKIYPAFEAVGVLVVFFALVLSATFVLNYVLDTAIYIQAAAENGGDDIIIIDAGHGGEDCGAIGKNGVFEKTLNLEISNYTASALRELGYTVVMTRTEDKMLYKEEENINGIRKISDLKNRLKIAEEYPGAIFVSIHMNSYSAERYSGFQAYFNGEDVNSRALANIIQQKVIEKTQPNNNRVIKDGSELYILKNSPTVAVLLECGFITNGEECEKLCEKEYQKELSFAIACGIIEYIEKRN